MARIDDLVSRVSDERLRRDLQAAVGQFRDGLKFGLVFEEHEPEVLPTPEVPVRAGSLAMDRSGRVVTVTSIRGEGPEAVATVRAGGGGGRDDSEELIAADLTAVARLGDPAFTTLRRIGSVAGPGCGDGTARHVAVEAENYLALGLLAGVYAGQVDCIYIDPPYNSGATDWKYNNRFVDGSDRYRHSKWLSMMQRRLKLAARLLKPDGVLIVTIDENEVHRLGVLLEQLFPAATRQMVTAVIVPVGNSRGTFSRVEEHALYVFTGDAPSVCEMPDDLLTGDASAGSAPVQPKEERWPTLLRSGNNSRPRDRPGLVYPVWVDASRTRIVAAGRTLAERVKAGEAGGDPASLDAFEPPAEEPPHPGALAVWPRKRTGALARWGLGPSTLMKWTNLGYAKVAWNSRTNTGTIYHLTSGQIDEIKSGALEVTNPKDAGPVVLGPRTPSRKPMTVWHRTRHDAGLHGTGLLRTLLGDKRFDFPKSLYSTLDAVAAVVADRPDALVVDFFAGSGTTLHAVAALNAADGGRRRCVAVSNNEVSAAEAKALGRRGLAPGDEDWEESGIFRHVLMPRAAAAVTGRRPDGEPVQGSYLPPLYQRPHSDGLAAAVEFFELVCADPQRLAAWDAFDEVHPLLWAASGGYGPCPTEQVGDSEALRRHEPGWLLPGGVIPRGCRYGVLLRPSRLRGFAPEFARRPEVTHVFVNAADRDELRHVEDRIRRDRPGVVVGWLFEDLYRGLDRGATA